MPIDLYFHIWYAYEIEVKCFHPFHYRATTLIFIKHTRLSHVWIANSSYSCFFKKIFYPGRIKASKQRDPYSDDNGTRASMRQSVTVLWFVNGYTHTHITAIKACGLLKMAENKFNETKVNGCAVSLLYFPFCYSRQERERALS